MLIYLLTEEIENVGGFFGLVHSPQIDEAEGVLEHNRSEDHPAEQNLQHGTELDELNKHRRSTLSFHLC